MTPKVKFRVTDIYVIYREVQCVDIEIYRELCATGRLNMTRALHHLTLAEDYFNLLR